MIPTSSIISKLCINILIFSNFQITLLNTKYNQNQTSPSYSYNHVITKQYNIFPKTKFYLYPFITKQSILFSSLILRKFYYFLQFKLLKHYPITLNQSIILFFIIHHKSSLSLLSIYRKCN